MSGKETTIAYYTKCAGRTTFSNQLWSLLMQIQGQNAKKNLNFKVQKSPF